MRFINYVICATWLLWLTGCSVLPMDTSTTDSNGGSVPKAGPGTVSDGPIGSESDVVSQQPARGPLTTNPYLQTVAPAPAMAQRQFQQAIAAQKAKNYVKAEVLLQELTANYPTLSGPYVNLGLVYLATNKPEQAKAAFSQAIRVNSNNLDAYNQLGVLAREQGKFEDAEKYYLQALAVWPEHAQSHRNIGILYELYMGKLDAALEHYQRYQQLLPEDDRQVVGWIADLMRRTNSPSASQ